MADLVTRILLDDKQFNDNIQKRIITINPIEVLIIDPRIDFFIVSPFLQYLQHFNIIT